MILLDTSSYRVIDKVVKVHGLSADTLEKIEEICGNMDLKEKQKIYDVSVDEVLFSAMRKTEAKEELTSDELAAMVKFSAESSKYEFTLKECKALLAAYQLEIIAVDEQDPAEFIEAAMQSPKYLKVLANMIFTEYRAAIDIPKLKKI